MATNQTFETIIHLNAQEAKNEMAALKKSLDELKKKKAEALRDPGTSVKDINKFDKQIKAAEASIKAYGNNVSKTIETINNLETASLGNIEKAAREVRRAMKQVTKPDEYNKLNKVLQRCKDRMDELKASSVQSKKEMQELDQAADNLKNVLGNINGASLNELTAAATLLQQKLGDIKPDSTAYHETAENISKIRSRIKQLSASQKEVNLTIDKYDEEIKAACRSSQDLERENKLINETLKNITGSSLRDLQYSLKIVNERLADQKQGTAAFEDLTDHAEKLKAQIAAINGEQEKSVSLFGKTANFLNKNWGAITQTIAAYSGLSSTVRQSVAAYAEMEESMANVRKYTGQTDEQVHQMNEDFKRLDTRTPREQLNELAGSAGRLGITNKQMIEEFVDGADKINVALGDDLGKGAVDKIGKLAQMFGEDRTKGLRGAMLATGSAVNELAQNSSANAGYIVDFTADLSGVGVQAGMTQAQIMGLASALDQNMQEEATSATVFSQLITKMYQEPAKFAKIAGMQVKEFTNLMKTNANEGLMTFLEAMKSKGGFDQMAPMFEAMNLNGTRAVGVLSAVASHLDQVKTAQDLATKSYSDGTSVINEFNTQNTTVQANLDKAKKQFQDLNIELGKKLIPISAYAISTMSIAIRTLVTLVTYVTNNAKELAMLGAAITVCTALWYKEAIVVKLNTSKKAINMAMDKALVSTQTLLKASLVALRATWALLTKGVQGYIAVMRAARIASLTNSWAALATVLTVVGVAVYGAVKAFNSYNEALRNNLQEVKNRKAVLEQNQALEKKVADATIDERSKIEMLTKIIHSNAYSIKERKAAIAALQRMVPKYHASISKEGKLYNENKKAIEDYVKKLEDAAMAEAIYEKKRAIAKKRLELKTKETKIKGSLKAVKAEREAHPNIYTTKKVFRPGTSLYDKGGYIHIDNDKLKSNKEQEWIHKKRLEAVVSQEKVLEAEDAALNRTINSNKNIKKVLTDIIKKDDDSTNTTNGNINLSSFPGYTNSTNNTGSTGDPEEDREAAAKKREQEMSAETKAAYEAELQAAKDKTEKEQAENLLAFSQGEKLYTEYFDARHDIAERGYQALEEIYQKYGTDYGQMQEEIASEQTEREKDHAKAMILDIEAYRQKAINQANNEFEDPKSDMYHDEEALNERLFEIDMTALADRKAALTEGTEEWLDVSAEMTQKEEEHALYLKKHYNDLLAQYRAEWGRKDIKEQEDIALKGLDSLHSKKLLKEEEYEEMKKKIRLHYAELESSENLKNSAGEQFKQNVQSAYNTASNNAQADYSNKHPNGLNVGNLITSDIEIYKSTLDNIKSMETEGVISHQEAMATMSEATGNMCNNLVTKMQAAMDAVSPLLSGMSSYYAAQSDYEVTVTEKKYEKLINAAGNNTAKTKKLEEKKEKEVAKIKSKYARKQVAMQIAQAIAQTALSALAAYSSAMIGVPYPANLILAPVAAGIAAAAGAIQIATIKKQQQAQEAGYYEGGFTSGKRYRREAGVVHEGEFVANHNAVNNPSILPALQLIDQAQRNNTVSTLTAADISRSIGQGGATVVSAPSVTVQTDNEELKNTINDTNVVIDNLRGLLAAGVHAKLSMTELDREWKHYQRLQSNK